MIRMGQTDGAWPSGAGDAGHALRRIARLLVTPAVLGAVTACVAVTTPTPSDTTLDRVDVQLTDALRIEPAAIEVPVGSPVRFVVTNTGALRHELFIGDEAAQAARGEAMTSPVTPSPEGPNVIAVEPGKTRDLVVTFPAPGSSLAGCHVDSHYLAGMRATITIR